MPSIQVKIVGDFCNLRCTYCRDRDFDQTGKRVMEQGVLAHLVETLTSLPQSMLRMHWLGGEPTLAGLPFFREVMRLQSVHPSKHWLNTIQTNATLIDDNWARFLIKHDFKVGVSIDGTRENHDRERINVAGHGTFDSSMRGVETLRRHNIKPSVICVVTKLTATSGGKALRSLVDAGFTHISFNPFYNTATNFAQDPFAVSDSMWLEFLQDIFEEWLALDSPDIRVREIDNMLAWTQGKVARACTFRGICENWVLVDYDGAIYPCERMGRHRCFGNILDFKTFQDVLHTPEYHIFTEYTSGIPEQCTVCLMKDFCQNGCVAHRELQDTSAPHYSYCGSRLAFYEYLRIQTGVHNSVATPAKQVSMPVLSNKPLFLPVFQERR